jgi:hypothetical protein
LRVLRASARKVKYFRQISPQFNILRKNWYFIAVA